MYSYILELDTESSHHVIFSLAHTSELSYTNVKNAIGNTRYLIDRPVLTNTILKTLG